MQKSCNLRTNFEILKGLLPRKLTAGTRKSSLGKGEIQITSFWDSMSIFRGVTYFQRLITLEVLNAVWSVLKRSSVGECIFCTICIEGL